MTAYASQQSAIDAVNLGAFQYLIKNAKNDEIKLIVRNAIEMRKVRVENLYLKRELRKGVTTRRRSSARRKRWCGCSRWWRRWRTARPPS